MDIVEELRRDREKGARRLEAEYKAGLMSLARRFGVNDSDAEELVNSTFATVVENIDDYIEQSAFFAWMCQILTSKYSRSIRRKSTQMEVFPGTVPDMVDESAQDAIYSNLDASLLRDAVGQLPEDQREVIILRYFVDMPISKIAKYLSIPSGTVRSRLHYAKLALAGKLGATVKKPGGKAVLIALALCALTALGAGVWHLAVPGEAQNPADVGMSLVASRMSSSEADTTGHATSDMRQAEASNLSTFQPFNFSTDNSQGEQNMNITTTRTAAMLAAGTMALAASPSAQASMDDWRGNAATPVVELVVDADMTLSQALSANNASLSGAASLVKLGNGTVTVDDESGIGSFAGEIHVFAGGWSVGTASGFGTSAGATWVYPNGCVLVTDVTVAHTGETFHLAGTGKHDDHGWGAIRFPGSSQNSVAMAAGAYGSRWILEDDATVLLSDNGNGRTFLPAIDLELNGHELTLWRGRYGRIATQYSASSQFGMFNSVTGAGNIVIKNGVTFTEGGFNPSAYTTGNGLVLQNAMMAFLNSKSKEGWRLIARPLPTSDWSGSGAAADQKPWLVLRNWKNINYNDNHDANVWRGPVTLEGDLDIIQENQSYAYPMTLPNMITGPGGIRVVNGKAWLYLDSTENDFQGGVTLGGPDNRLVLANDGALPANGGPLKLTDSSVSFPSTVAAPWSLPDLELAGASSVGNCQGSWKSVTALSGATATYNSALGASNLILKAGSTLTLGSSYSASDYYGYRMWYSTAMNGVYTFEQLRATGTKQDHASEKNGRYVYNWFNNSLSSNTAYSPIGSNADGVIGYEGWVWCDGLDGTEWTFALSYGDKNKFYLKINDTVIWNWDNNGYGDNSPHYNVQMKHGWNRFLGMTKNGWTAATGGSWGLRGLCVDTNGRNSSSSSDYDYFSDPGDGSSVVYMCGDDEADGYSWHGTFQNLAMEAGSTLNVDGSLSVETAKGAGSVDNGDLTVTQALVVDPTVFANNGGIAVDGDLVFGNGAKISFPDSDSYRENPAGFYTLATATGSITGFDPSMLELGGTRRCWNVSLSQDGRALSLELVPECTVISIR